MGGYTKALTVAAAVAIAACAATADNVNVGGMSYNNVTVRDVSGGTISFVMQATGVEVIKRFSDVRRIEVATDARFTKAEKDFAAGDYETALDGFRHTATSALKPWMKTVAEVRLITCYQHAAQLGKAVALYFKHFKGSPAMVAGVKLERIGPVGSAGNKDALVKLRKLAASAEGPTLAKVNEVLKSVLAVEDPDAAAVVGDDDDQPGTTPSDVKPPAGNISRQLRRIASMVAQRKNSEALKVIDKLRKSSEAGTAAVAAELYFQEGVARKQRAVSMRRGAKKARDAGRSAEADQLDGQASAEFLRSGYSLLRLPLTRSLAGSAKAARALYEVGMTYRDHIGRNDMAKKCFELVRSRYPKSPWARSAGNMLRTLN